jgi:hypothetical protein
VRHVGPVHQLVDRQAQDRPVQRGHATHRPALGVLLEDHVDLHERAGRAADQLACEDRDRPSGGLPLGQHVERIGPGDVGLVEDVDRGAACLAARAHAGRYFTRSM